MKKLLMMILISFFFLVNSLFLFAQYSELGGKYKAYGVNPDGSRYAVDLEIKKSSKSYNFEWKFNTPIKGNGVISKNILEVDFGDKNPVCYEILQNGRVLVGTWAGGGAIEVAVRSDNKYKVDKVSGEYKVIGTNPDGSIYRGKVNVSKDGEEYFFKWLIAGKYGGGKGRYNDEGYLVVDFGEETPILYGVFEGGHLLIGLWAEYEATEILYR